MGSALPTTLAAVGATVVAVAAIAGQWYVANPPRVQADVAEAPVVAQPPVDAAVPESQLPCNPMDVRMFASVDEYRAALVVNVGFTNKGGECRLTGALMLEVLDSNHQRARGIFANPDGGPVRLTLAPGQVFETSVFAWENWCGLPGEFQLRLTFGGQVTDISTKAPTCADAPAGSQLRSHKAAQMLVDTTEGSSP